MSVFETEAFDAHESLHAFFDEPTGLRCFIAIHSTRRGPAAGGVRLWRYPDSAAAMTDVLRLARGMSFKSAITDLPLGGGKAVIMKPDEPVDRAAMFAFFGRCVDSLGGRYVTAEDVGVGPDDMRAVAGATRHVAGLPEGRAASGDPSPITARGVFLGLKAAVERALGRAGLRDLRVAVQGAGHVGSYLCALLAEAGARVVVADVDAAAAARVAERFGAEIVAPDAIYDCDVEVFSPNALGAVINPATIDRLRCRVVAGGANNQLARPEMGAELARRGIVYAPDYAINGGGIINIAAEIAGAYDPDWVEAKLAAMIETLKNVLDRAAREDRSSADVADEIARERLGSGTPTPALAPV